MRRSGIALLGLLVFGVFSILYTWYKVPRIEADIAARTEAELSAAGLDFARVEVDGREVSLTGAAQSEALRQRAGETADRVRGRRTVDNRIEWSGSRYLPPVAAAPPPAPRSADCDERWDAVAAQRLYFNSDSASLADAPVVEDIVAVAADCPKVRVEVGGHTDATGSAEYNRRLSQRRAQAFVEILGSRGVEVARIAAVGYGESEPAASNATPTGRAQNRRIEFTVEED